EDIDAELKRLKLELKQTMEMYNGTTQEEAIAIPTGNGVTGSNVESAEEVTLQMIEIEKQKARAAIEAAQTAQRLAELEAHKRRTAEKLAKQEKEEKMKALKALAQNEVRYRKYTIEDIESATENFSAQFKIGEGGYGPVYKGCLDHTAVAIKVLKADAKQGKRQFQQEIEVLSAIRHPNMVLLLGACPDHGCLVYEYLENGSLEDRLFCKDDTPPIPWTTRFKIACEIATGLLFLHQAKPEPLVHRDLKPGNILLDRNYLSKISDVGLARLVPSNDRTNTTTMPYAMTAAAGTFCYIDPEYQQTGLLNVKSDIYSLGILLLQIITVKPPMGLTHHVRKAIREGTFADMIDPNIRDCPFEAALSFTELALSCAELRRKDRPDLDTEVLPELTRLKEFGMAYEATFSRLRRPVSHI
ncbi:Serine-threonine/tyrosine-protein kinase, catalytic domain, partial [Dillenia turbinata]